MKRSLAPVTTAVMITLLAGCTSMAPNYERPEVQLPDEQSTAIQIEDVHSSDTRTTDVHASDTARAAKDIPWQEFFRDKRLQQVIDLALNNNRDLRATLADVRAARATYRGTSADQYPGLDAGVSGTRARSRTTGTQTSTSNSWQATVGISSYEIDLFGKAASLTDADLESYLASAETARSAAISLIAETADAWLTLASDQNLLKLAEETAANAKRAMDISAKRKELGVDSGIDLVSAESTYQSARADIARYRTQVAQDKNALWLLVGHTLDASLLPSELPSGDALMSEIPAGISSDVLLQRPDVLAAEHDLKAANANIGAARAAYFPSLNLTATSGLASAALVDLFTGGAATIWTIAPSLTLPIFNWGGTSADLEYSKAEKEKYIANYEYAVQTAFQEVADALARRATIGEQTDATQGYASAAEKSYDLSWKRYKAGIDSLQDALQYQRTLYSAQQSLISVQLEELNNRITLYRVLGGGLAEQEGNDTVAVSEEGTGTSSVQAAKATAF
ncbi:MAG: efflux transporter outer membrane subunit [Oceanobacter sp.]